MSAPLALTPRVVAYALSEEALVLEAYKDSVGVWTWAGGVTDASGHTVYPRYLDKPQPIERCLEVTIWLMREKYLPAVQRTFAASNLTEAQLAAALSFHWNTGAILRARWVAAWLRGNTAEARDLLLQWTSGGLLTARRLRERELFFAGTWPDDMDCMVLPVKKPAYTPWWRKGVKMDLLPMIEQVMA